MSRSKNGDAGQPKATGRSEVEDLRAEVERLTGSLEETQRRLDRDGHPEDRIRLASLHIDAALAGVSRPQAMALHRAEAAEAKAESWKRIASALRDEGDRATAAEAKLRDVEALADEWEKLAYACVRSSDCPVCVTYQGVVIGLRRAVLARSQA